MVLRSGVINGEKKQHIYSSVSIEVLHCVLASALGVRLQHLMDFTRSTFVQVFCLILCCVRLQRRRHVGGSSVVSLPSRNRECRSSQKHFRDLSRL